MFDDNAVAVAVGALRRQQLPPGRFLCLGCRRFFPDALCILGIEKPFGNPVFQAAFIQLPELFLAVKPVVAGVLFPVVGIAGPAQRHNDRQGHQHREQPGRHPLFSSCCHNPLCILPCMQYRPRSESRGLQVLSFLSADQFIRRASAFSASLRS